MEAYYNYEINDDGHLEHYGNKPSDYSTDVLAHKAVQFIQKARHPFFLYFAPVAPHLPAIPDKQDQAKLENIAPIHSPAFIQRNIGKEPWRFWHRTCSAPRRSSTSTTAASARRSPCSRSTAA
jgi:hypothetical protein